jgi:hypothetical protein
MNPHGFWFPKRLKRRLDATSANKGKQIMAQTIPLDWKNLQHGKQQNTESN